MQNETATFLRAPRANRGFGTDEKRIRSKTTVIDKSKNATPLQRHARTHESRIQTLHPT
jgi:hypothetical protein